MDWRVGQEGGTNGSAPAVTTVGGKSDSWFEDIKKKNLKSYIYVRLAKGH